MKIEYTTTKEDFINFNIEHYVESEAGKRNLFIVRYVIPILFGVVVFFIGTVLLHQSPLYWGLGVSLYVLFAINLTPARQRKAVRKRIQQLIAHEDSYTSDEGCTLELTADAVIEKRTDHKAYVLKQNITQIRKSNDFYSIYSTEDEPLFIPRRVLQSEVADSLELKLSEIKPMSN
ncbi:MAG: hypothetical protein ACRC5C_06635 [Bacilli bacterium]